MSVNRVWIEGSPQVGITAAAQTTIGTTAAQILAANARRKGLIVQNTGTTVIKIVLGSGTPTQTVYHVALGACTAADDGKGGAYFDSSWIGPVQGISSGAGGTFVLTEITVGNPNWDANAGWGLT